MPLKPETLRSRTIPNLDPETLAYVTSELADGQIRSRSMRDMTHYRSQSGVARGLVDDFKVYAGRVARGEVAKEGLQNFSDLAKRAMAGDTDAAIELGLNFSPGALTVAGRGAKTANLRKLLQAEDLAKKGASADDIFNSTGWWQGPDKKWRFEIDDSAAQLSSKPLPTEYIESVGRHEPSWKVGDALDHKQLYDAYPDLKNIPSSFQYGSSGEAASYRPGMGGWVSYSAESMRKSVPSPAQQQYLDALRKETDAFYARPDVKKYYKAMEDDALLKGPEAEFMRVFNELGGPAIDAEASRLAQASLGSSKLAGGGYGLRDTGGTTLHELQHAIQEREGFARGGSTSELAARYRSAQDEYNLLWETMQKNPERSAEIMPVLEKLRAEYRNLADPVDAYRRLAGEVEARAVQKRMNMTLAERAKRPFWLDYDVPVEDQIINYK